MATETFLYVWNLTALQKSSATKNKDLPVKPISSSEAHNELWEILDCNRTKAIPKQGDGGGVVRRRPRKPANNWTVRLKSEWEEIEPALCYYIDGHLSGLDPVFSSQWSKQTLGVLRHGTNQGGTYFFSKYLEPDLKSVESDPSERTPQMLRRLELYLACLHFGFQGQKTRLEIDDLKTRLTKVVGGEFSLSEFPAQFCPSAYLGVKSEMLSLPAEKPLYWALGFGAALLSVLMAWHFSRLYDRSVKNLNDSVGRVMEAAR